MRIRQLLSNYQVANATGVTVNLLRSLGIPVTARTAVEAVEHHPDYPSLLSISDSLRKWKMLAEIIRNTAKSRVRLNSDE